MEAIYWTGHPKSEPKKCVPPSILYIPHNSYQTTESTSEFFAELFVLLYISVQLDSFIW